MYLGRFNFWLFSLFLSSAVLFTLNKKEKALALSGGIASFNAIGIKKENKYEIQHEEKEEKKHKEEKKVEEKHEEVKQEKHEEVKHKEETEHKEHKEEKKVEEEKHEEVEEKEQEDKDKEELHEENEHKREISFDIAEDAPDVKSPPLVKQDSKVYNKRNSTSTLYIRGTVSNPDIVELLKCISLSIQKQVLPERLQDESDKMRIFDERMFPIQESLDIDIAVVPQEFDIFLFIGKAFDTENLAAESAILMRAYIDRLIEKSGLILYPWNWRRVVLSTLILASKVWEEEEVWNSDFKSILPCVTARDLNILEKHILTLLQYNVTLKSSEYAKYYFEVRSLTNNLPDTPLDNTTAELIEAKTSKREEVMSSNNNNLQSKRREIQSYNPGKIKSNTPAVLS